MRLFLLCLCLVGCAKPFAVEDWSRENGTVSGVPTRTSWRIRVPLDMVADLGVEAAASECLEGPLGGTEWCHIRLEGGCMDLFQRPDDAVLLIWADRCETERRRGPRGREAPRGAERVDLGRHP